MDMDLYGEDGNCILYFPDIDENDRPIDQTKAVWLEDLDFVGVIIGDDRVPLGFFIKNAAEHLPKWIVEEMNFFKGEQEGELDFPLVYDDWGLGYLRLEKRKDWAFGNCCSTEYGLVFDLSPEGRILGVEFQGTFEEMFYHYCKEVGRI